LKKIKNKLINSFRRKVLLRALLFFKQIKLPDKISLNRRRFFSRIKLKLKNRLRINRKEENTKMQNITKKMNKKIKKSFYVIQNAIYFLKQIRKIKMMPIVVFVLIFSFITVSFDKVYATDNPTVILTSTNSDPTNENINVTATFSESVSNFAVGDILVINGTVGTFSGSGTTYTFIVTPSTDGVVVVDVPADVATDIDGNGNLSTTYEITVFGFVKKMGGISNDVSNSIVVDSSGYIYNRIF